MLVVVKMNGGDNGTFERERARADERKKIKIKIRIILETGPLIFCPSNQCSYLLICKTKNQIINPNMN